MHKITTQLLTPKLLPSAFILLAVSSFWLALKLNFALQLPIFEPTPFTIEHPIKITNLEFQGKRGVYLYFNYLNTHYRTQCNFTASNSTQHDPCRTTQSIKNPNITLRNATFLQAFSTGSQEVILKNGIFIINDQEIALSTTPKQQTDFVASEHTEARWMLVGIALSLSYILLFYLNHSLKTHRQPLPQTLPSQTKPATQTNVPHLLFLLSLLLFLIFCFYFLYNYPLKFPTFQPLTLTPQHPIQISAIRSKKHQQYLYFNYLGQSYRAPCQLEYQAPVTNDPCQTSTSLKNPNITLKNLSFIQPFSTGGKQVILKEGILATQGKEVAFFTTPEQQAYFVNFEHNELRFAIAVLFLSLLYIIAFSIYICTLYYQHKAQNK